MVKSREVGAVSTGTMRLVQVTDQRPAFSEDCSQQGGERVCACLCVCMHVPVYACACAHMHTAMQSGSTASDLLYLQGPSVAG